MLLVAYYLIKIWLHGFPYFLFVYNLREKCPTLKNTLFSSVLGSNVIEIEKKLKLCNDPVWFCLIPKCQKTGGSGALSLQKKSFKDGRHHLCDGSKNESTKKKTIFIIK